MKYRVFAALTQDIDAGFVWIGKPSLPSRTIIRIHCVNTGKKIHCESLSIDSNYLKKYNQPPRFTIDSPDNGIVMSIWYRNCLGINLNTSREFDFTIKTVNNICGRIRSSLNHPNNAIRLAAVLALISVGLGISGLTLGIISLIAK